MQRIVFGKRGPCLQLSLLVSPDITRVLRSRFDTPIDSDCRTKRISFYACANFYTETNYSLYLYAVTKIRLRSN